MNLKSTISIFLLAASALAVNFPKCKPASESFGDGQTIHQLYRASQTILGYSDVAVYKMVTVGKAEYTVREIFLKSPEIIKKAENDLALHQRFKSRDAVAPILSCFEDPARRILYTVYSPFRSLLSIDAYSRQFQKQVQGKDLSRLAIYRDIFRALDDLQSAKAHFSKAGFSVFGVRDSSKSDGKSLIQLVDFSTLVFGQEDNYADLFMEKDYYQNGLVYNKAAAQNVQEMCLEIMKLEHNYDFHLESFHLKDQNGKEINLIGKNFDGITAEDVAFEKTVNYLTLKIGYAPRDPTLSLTGFLLHCLKPIKSKIPKAASLGETLSTMLKTRSDPKIKRSKFVMDD